MLYTFYLTPSIWDTDTASFHPLPEENIRDQEYFPISKITIKLKPILNIIYFISEEARNLSIS